jgi:hypothetical protein
MTEPTQTPPPAQPIEAVKLFNEYQAQWRARVEAALKLVMVVSGGMLTLSVGAVLSGSAFRVRSDLLPPLEWAWGFLFFSITGSILLLAGMIAASFHIGVRWKKALEAPTGKVKIIASWTWLRLLNAIVGVAVLVSFLVGVALVARVAVSVADAAVPARTVQVATAQPEAAKTPEQHSEAGLTADAKERAEKAALDRRLVEYNGDLAHYTKVLAIVAALQFAALLAQAAFLLLAFRETRRGADIAREAMIAGERAFVFALDVSPFWEINATTGAYDWRFRPVWKNSGDTPTRNMIMHTSCMIQTTPLPPGFNFDDPDAQTGRGLIPPNTQTLGGVAPTPPAPAITPQDILDVRNGTKFIFLWGWARYFDVFPGTEQHITRFCWLIDPVGDPTIPYDANSPTRVIFRTIHHSEGNCADEECAAPQLVAAAQT